MFDVHFLLKKIFVNWKSNLLFTCGGKNNTNSLVRWTQLNRQQLKIYSSEYSSKRDLAVSWKHTTVQALSLETHKSNIISAQTTSYLCRSPKRTGVYVCERVCQWDPAASPPMRGTGGAILVPRGWWRWFLGGAAKKRRMVDSVNIQRGVEVIRFSVKKLFSSFWR